MNVSIGKRWQDFIDKAVETGRYGSASEVVREGLRLVEERETKLLVLRETLSQSLADGGDISDDELSDALDRRAQDLASRAS